MLAENEDLGRNNLVTFNEHLFFWERDKHQERHRLTGLRRLGAEARQRDREGNLDITVMGPSFPSCQFRLRQRDPSGGTGFKSNPWPTSVILF